MRWRRGGAGEGVGRKGAPRRPASPSCSAKAEYPRFFVLFHVTKRGGTHGGTRIEDLDTIPSKEYIGPCVGRWSTRTSSAFGGPVSGEREQEDIAATVELPMEHGPTLPFPYSSGLEGSRHGHMRELRIQSGGRPIRVFYAFDPRRAAILPVGGDKTGDDRFYERFVPLADRLYDEHLKELKDKGSIQ